MLTEVSGLLDFVTARLYLRSGLVVVCGFVVVDVRMRVGLPLLRLVWGLGF